MKLDETVDDDRLPFVARYREALAQTVSEESFSAIAIQTMAEDWGKDTGEDRVQSVMFNLLETIEDAEHSNEVDFRLASDEVEIEGQSLGEDPFEESRPNRYIIKGMLGSGGMGQVFSVHDTSFDRLVAVKFLHPKAAALPDKMRDFLREAKLTAQLEHPNIFPVHDVNISDGGMPYFSMRKANGESLRELLDEAKPPHSIPEPIKRFNDRVAIIIKVCDAISYAHSQGLIHQDVKPSNIMIGDYGEVIVVDWGTARNLADEGQGEKPKLQGTPIYMSPEQARREFSTILSDVYCIGATFFHMLTFRYPIWSDDPTTFWDIKKQGIIASLTPDELRTIPSPLISIALKAMAADPSDRYQSVMEMRNDLINYQRGLRVLAHHDSLVDVCKRTYTLNKRAAWVGLVALLLLCVLGYGVYNELMKSQSEWRVVYEYDFTNASMFDLEKDWNGYRYYKFTEQKTYPFALDNTSPCSIKEGALHIDASGTGENYYNVSFAHHISGDIRAEWDTTPLIDGKSVNCFIGAPNRFDAYMFHIGGGRTEGYKYMTKCEQFIDQTNTNILVPNQTYRMRMEKEGEFVRLYVDDALNFEYRDIDIMRGPGHQTFGFEALHNHVRIDNIKISSRPLPQKISPIMVANSLAANQRNSDAIEHYQDISRAYPDSELDALATYRRGRCLAALDQLDQALVAFNDFRYRFPAHELMGYVLRDMGLTYCRKNNWDQAAKYFNEIVAGHPNLSLRRSTYQAIELLLWDIIDPRDPSQLVLPDALERADRALNLLNLWSEALGVTVSEYNSIRPVLADVYLANGQFARVLKDFDLENWPYASYAVLAIRGQTDEAIKHFTDINPQPDMVKKILRRAGDLDKLLELYPNDKSVLLAQYSKQHDLEKIKELVPDPANDFRVSYALGIGDYEYVLTYAEEHSGMCLRALYGLGRYAEINNERFRNQIHSVNTALIASGQAEKVLAESANYSMDYVKAAAALGLDSHQQSNLDLYAQYRQLTCAGPFLINVPNVDNASFERFILFPFLDALAAQEGQDIEALFTELVQNEKYRELALPQVMKKYVLGQEVSAEEDVVFVGIEPNRELCLGMRAELADKSADALKWYRTSLEKIRPHARSVPSAFLRYRIQVLETH